MLGNANKYIEHKKSNICEEKEMLKMSIGMTDLVECCVSPMFFFFFFFFENQQVLNSLRCARVH